MTTNKQPLTYKSTNKLTRANNVVKIWRAISHKGCIALSKKYKSASSGCHTNRHTVTHNITLSHRLTPHLVIHQVPQLKHYEPHGTMLLALLYLSVSLPATHFGDVLQNSYTFYQCIEYIKCIIKMYKHT